MSGEMGGFPDIGAPVLVRPSGEVRLNKWRAFRSNGALNLPAGLMTVHHETIFKGMATGTFTAGDYRLDDGILYNVSRPAGAGVVEITTSGLHITQGTSAESHLQIIPASQPDGLSIFYQKLGADVCRRGRFAFWSHVDSYVLASSLDWTYVCYWGCGYPAHYGGVRRARNTQGAPNNSTGAYTVWSAFNGTDTANVLSANAEIGDNGTTTHNGTEDVICVFFHNSMLFDVYYGTWNGDWPAFEDMKFGFRVDQAAAMTTMGWQVKHRDPKVWILQVGGGGQGYHTGTEITIDRWRLTSWN